MKTIFLLTYSWFIRYYNYVKIEILTSERVCVFPSLFNVQYIIKSREVLTLLFLEVWSNPVPHLAFYKTYASCFFCLLVSTLWAQDFNINDALLKRFWSLCRGGVFSCSSLLIEFTTFYTRSEQFTVSDKHFSNVKDLLIVKAKCTLSSMKLKI